MLGIFSRTNTLGFKGRKLRFAVTITACLAFSLFGYDQGLMGSLITGTQFNDEFPATRKNGDDDQHATVIQGAVTSCFELGCFAGSLWVMFFGERVGRKPLITFGTFVVIIGVLISVTSYREHWGLGQFVIGRVTTGFGVGFCTSQVPIWQSEMSKPENRGLLVNLEGSTIAVGTMIAYWVTFGLSYVDSSAQWRFPVSLQILFALFVLFGILNLPESPRWLMAHNRENAALEILGKLDDLPIDDDQIIAEASVIQDAVNRFKHQKTSVKDLFSKGKSQNLHRALVASSTQFFQQFTGCNAAIYYATVLFNESIGLEKRLSMILGGVFATIYALSTIPSFFLIESLGRRKLFLIGASGQAISFTITFACLIDNNTNNSKGAAVGLFLFIVFFGMSMLSLPWIYPPEIASMRVRSMTNAMSTCTNWLCNFAVVMFTPIFIQNSDSWGCYLFFAIINYLYIPVIFFFYPETAGRSLEEIDIIYAKAFTDGTQPWRVAATLPKLSLTEVEDYGNSLGLYDDDNDKEEEEEKEEDGVSNNEPTGVNGYNLFVPNEEADESSYSSTSRVDSINQGKQDEKISNSNNATFDVDASKK
ncbi:probable Sugar transporter STL1 [Saccharomycodes ludwigii]|uniref:Probable Sugar transporter STL1 n=2 Tax=Saccharomycodes ludwigii TaxID=36035 RepID=A0A376B8C3_9ASCO|nr:probable Sugar transporter STL1 [Saccharomycodes ludwigii]